jgi:hypothetical protein
MKAGKKFAHIITSEFFGFYCDFIFCPTVPVVVKNAYDTETQ